MRGPKPRSPCIVFGQGSKGIMRVSPEGGTPDVLVRVRDGEMALGPQLLPGGRHVLFTVATLVSFRRDKATLSYHGGQIRVVLNWFEELKSQVPTQ